MFKKTMLFGSDEPKGWMPWGLLAVILAALMAVVPLIVSVPLMRAAGLIPERGAPTLPVDLTASLIIPFALGALLVFLWVRFVEKRSLASIGLGGAGKGKEFGIGALVGVGMIAVTVAGIWIAGGYTVAAIAPVFAAPSALGFMLLLLVGYAVQASAEEILMRGWLLSALSHKFGFWIAAIVSSGLFTLLHFDPENPNLLVDSATSMLFGLFACYWAFRSGSIWAVMGWHTAWNWFQGIGFTIPVTGQQSTVPALVAEMIPSGAAWLTGGETGPEASVICLIALVAGMIVIRRVGNSPSPTD